MPRKKSEVLHVRVSTDFLLNIKRLAKAERRADSFVARDLMELGWQAKQKLAEALTQSQYVESKR